MENKRIVFIFLIMVAGSELGAMEAETKRSPSPMMAQRLAPYVFTDLDYLKVGESANYDIARQCLNMLNIDKAHKLLSAILVNNARLACSQKCELIQVVRARENYKEDAFLDAIERLLMRGVPSHELNREAMLRELNRANFTGE